MNNIVCFGEAIIDFLGVTASDKTISYQRNAGGAPANVAVAVATLGGTAAFVGMFSYDTFGDFLLDSLQQAGVDISNTVRTDQANTALAFVTLNQHGERSFSFYRPPAADLLFTKTDFNESLFADMYALHVCSNSLTEADIAETTFTAMQRARVAGALVSFDMNLRPRLWHPATEPLPRLWRALNCADLVKLSAEEMSYLVTHAGSEKNVLEELWQGHTRLLIVTHGAGPVQWFTQQAQGESQAFVTRAIDTTAAGDAFVGGLLTSLAEHNVSNDRLSDFAASVTFKDALRFASACGAVAVTRNGAFSAMPSRADVQKIMRAAP